MGLSFLPQSLQSALAHLNYNFLSEIRLRQGKEIVVEYKGEKNFLTNYGISKDKNSALFINELTTILNVATGGCIYNYSEQLKNGFITVNHGIRIGIAGEYVTENSAVKTVRNITSLNIRLPHDVKGCAAEICGKLFYDKPKSTLIFSKPGLGKTTMLRDIARTLSADCVKNVLILDERNEIAAVDEYGSGFDVGFSDVIRCHGKLGGISGAIRAMKPEIIVTDELYGDDDIKAVKYAYDCGITVIASSHITDKDILKSMPFDYYVKLTAVGGPLEIYAENFDSCLYSSTDDFIGGISVGKQKKENASIL